ncbi:MAG: hypothetical protein KAS04_01440 [Candidatus Aenigmarchaeota archaeon]|nr:hypothetical protein [Candidatus Aenigmarchaeota archaeon]
MKYVWSLIAMCMMFFLVSQGATAYNNFAVEIVPTTASGCISNFEFSVDVINLDDTNHEYQIFLETPEGWSGLPSPSGGVPPSLKTPVLAPGGSYNFNVVVTPSLGTAPGNHEAKIIVKQGSDVFEKKIDVEILNCHSVSVEADEIIDMCENTPFQYIAEVSNNGKDSEEFEITAISSWDNKEIYKDTVVINSGETEEVYVDITTPEESGVITLNIVSKESYAETKMETQVNVRNCYDFRASIEPKETQSCIGGSSKFVLAVENLGETFDTYDVRLPDWVVLEKESIEVLAGQEETMDLFAYPELEGTTSFDVIVVSRAYPSSKIILAGNVVAAECKGVAVIVTPAEQEVCKGNDAELSISMKNTGKVPDTYELTSSIGSLESNKANVEPGQISKVGLTIKTDKLEFGATEVIVNAKSGEMSDENKVILNVKNCYAVEIAVSPQTSEVCVGDYINYTLAVKNIGEFTDSYKFFFEKAQIGETTLEQGQIKVFATGMVVDSESGEYEFNFKAVSDFVLTEAKVKITVKENDECYSLEIESEENALMIKNGEGTALAIKITNSGERAEVYDFVMEGPEWVYISENSVQVLPGEEKHIYLYASPDYDVEDGVYDVILKTTSGTKEKTLNLKFGVNVMPVFSGLPSDVDGNAQTDITTPTGQISQFQMSGDTGKVILLVVIVALIIIILAVKFVLFVK